jgi:succinyl-diaminopimelate desuccinylase
MTGESDGSDASALHTLARELVRIPTENPPGEEGPAAAFVAEWFAGQGIDAELVREPEADRPQVAARVGPEDPDGPTVVLNGHLDVVPAGEESAWSVDPYAGEVVDGRLYGRGSADMKTGIAVAMLVARDLGREIRAGDLPGSVVVHAAMGEETGDPGTKTLLARGYGGDVGIVLEPTDFRVATSTRGLAVYRIVVRGKATHASQPDAGTNAIGGARRVLNAVEAHDADLRDRRGSLCGGARATVTAVESGTGSNPAVVPDRAEVVLDRRVRPDESIPAVDNEVDTLLDRLARENGIDATHERIQTYAPSSVPTDHPLATCLRERSVGAVGSGGGVGEPWGIEAATDARNFVNDAGTPAVTWGPGRLDEAHTVDESIDLGDAETGRRILEDAVRALLGGDVL